MQYNKPHLSYEALVDHVIDRGLICTDRSSAIAIVGQVGYYRLSAYAYPFRRLLIAPDEGDSPYKFRSDLYLEGARFEDAIALYKFDRKLRAILVEGLESIEVGLRVRIAQVLGARDKFGHTNESALDSRECSKVDRDGLRSFDSWIHRYNKLRHQARAEDYVAHFIHKYESNFPIWVAVEFLDFGALVRLYNLLLPQDKTAVALGFGVKAGGVFGVWLQAFSYVRNLGAHHSRVWNRNLTLKVGRVPPTATLNTDLTHVAEMQASAKLYRTAAALAYCVRSLNPDTAWPSSFRTHVRKFPLPAVPVNSPQLSMGFPAGWHDERLWLPSSER